MTRLMILAGVFGAALSLMVGVYVLAKAGGSATVASTIVGTVGWLVIVACAAYLIGTGIKLWRHNG